MILETPQYKQYIKAGITIIPKTTKSKVPKGLSLFCSLSLFLPFKQLNPYAEQSQLSPPFLFFLPLLFLPFLLQTYHSDADELLWFPVCQQAVYFCLGQAGIASAV